MISELEQRGSGSNEFGVDAQVKGLTIGLVTRVLGKYETSVTKMEVQNDESKSNQEKGRTPRFLPVSA